jgi:hypothetical protein
MKLITVGAALLLSLTGCTSGLFAEEATQPVDQAKLLLLKDTLDKGARAQATFYVETGRFASQLSELDLTVPEGVAISLTQVSIGDYCLTGTLESLEGGLWHVSQEDTAPTQGPC